MTIQLKITEEDIFNYQVYATERLELYKKHLALFRYIPTAAFLVLVLAMGVGEYLIWKEPALEGSDAIGIWGIGIGYSLLMAYLWFRFSPELFKGSMKRRARKYLASLNEDFNCEDEMTLDDKGIRIVCDKSDSFYKWHAINKIERNNDDIYISLSELHALIIPGTTFTDKKESDQFIDLVSGYISTKIHS